MRRLVGFLLFLVLLLPALARAESGSIRRFALVAGANDGGASRARLRYATSDAIAVARVLEELGGVAPADRLLLEEPDRAALQAGIEEMRRRLEQERGDRRVELFVYYSGHSDEEGLLLGEERFGYDELREALESLPADVRVAILDSCSSGALTRRKGGTRRPPFLVDEASRVKGHAYLTSSSADEAAQESDRIGASFFTHYLVSGLRGAADTTRDGRVTLTEAYQFAFAETLARTEKTQSGAQHPAYEMQLVGTGDLVMTDLRTTDAGLLMDESIAGRVYVRDPAGTLVVELRKLPATPVELGLSPGDYVVTVEDRGTISEARLVLAKGQRVTLDRARLVPVEAERNRIRGDEEYVRMPFVLGITPGFVPGDNVITGFGLNPGVGRTARLDGVDLGFGLSWHTERADGAMFTFGGNLVEGDMDGVQFALGFNHADGELSGMQAAVGVNVARRKADFGQFSVGANIAGADMSGVQATVGVNWVGGRMGGAQLSSGVNIADELDGVQFASGVNWASGLTSGAQIAPGLNYAGGAFEGLQISSGVNLAVEGGEAVQVGVVNWSDGPLSGLQAAAGFSWAPRIDGAQIGIVNVGGSVDGAQVGVVNIATGRVDGAQVGVVNYADEADAPIGLVSVVRKGRFHLDLWADETNAANLGVELGARHLYGILTVGTAGETSAGELRWTTGLGIGGYLPVEMPALSFVQLEGLWRQVHRGTPWTGDESFQGIFTLRLAGGWRLAERFAVIAGPSLNLSVADDDAPHGGFGPFGARTELRDGANTDVHFWPGFFLGVQI